MQNQAQGPAPAVPALESQKQEDGEFKDSLGYAARPCLRK